MRTPRFEIANMNREVKGDIRNTEARAGACATLRQRRDAGDFTNGCKAAFESPAPDPEQLQTQNGTKTIVNLFEVI